MLQNRAMVSTLSMFICFLHYVKTTIIPQNHNVKSITKYLYGIHRTTNERFHCIITIDILTIIRFTNLERQKIKNYYFFQI